MRIECPSCGAGFDVNPKVLEPSGRTVRCASCKTTWFAAAPALAMAEAEAAHEVALEPMPEAAPEIPPMPSPAVTAEDRADHEALKAVAKKPEATKKPEIVAPHEDDITYIEDAPSSVPEEPEPVPAALRRKLVMPVAASAKRPTRVPLGFVTAILFGVVALGLVSRHAVVRAAPELASLYAAIGFPVNLRGLEFQNIRTKQEIQDGITVLAIEGEVENVVSRAVELPRVRLAVIGENGSEIYAWTTLLPRSILYPHERVPFKSRLASPPAAGKEIMVRFLTRADLTAAAR